MKVKWIRSRKCKNGIAKNILAGLRKDWTILSAVIGKVFRKVDSETEVSQSLGQDRILQACRFSIIFAMQYPEGEK
jgi:hypothetical protein